MIPDSDLKRIGKVFKPHGIKGEVNCAIDENIDPSVLKYVIIKTEGINVPFFIESLRMKGHQGYLIKFRGIDNIEDTTIISSSDISILKTTYDESVDSGGSDDRIYLDDMIGFTVYDGNIKVGRITGIEDSTENVLFIVETDSKKDIYLPVVEDLIEEIDSDNNKIIMNLPQGITEL